MFDASLPELVLVFVIALLVLGPQRLPKVAAELGKWVGRARRTATQLRRQLEREIELAEIQPPSAPSSSAGLGAASNLSPSAREMSDALADSAAGRAVPPPAPGASAATPAPASVDSGASTPASSDAAPAAPPSHAAPGSFVDADKDSAHSHDKPPSV
jgi:sec-independent protein translocase protein TatB